jgi:hypothetical protein
MPVANCSTIKEVASAGLDSIAVRIDEGRAASKDALASWLSVCQLVKPRRDPSCHTH